MTPRFAQYHLPRFFVDYGHNKNRSLVPGLMRTCFTRGSDPLTPSPLEEFADFFTLSAVPRGTI